MGTRADNDIGRTHTAKPRGGDSWESAERSERESAS